ncbi:MAG: carbamoyl phosphate synthase small subunit, partial [Trichodesmium sp. St19_bin2]|nr:carbamoyl phosphate synthase small subunit [Trichodesmium sp. St19_bin2]
GLNLVQKVTTKETYQWSEPTNPDWEFNLSVSGNTGEKFTVVAIDFGVKKNILRRLASYGCQVIVVPADTPPEEILKHNPDGIFLSNGPGDPSAVREGIETTKELLKSSKPVFGICMGHQVLGLALGADTFKLKFGHRGLNQPAGLQQRVEITSQNHGFAINADSLVAELEITHLNLNDQTVAGLRHKSLPLFSVQYHPEASPGPHDADYLFERFVQAMKDTRKVKALS